MLKKKRQAQIMEVLLREESVTVNQLAELLDVSSVTIRKDLTELEQAGKLYRSHGKAIIINPFTFNRSVNEKEKIAVEQKEAIGREAAKLIKGGGGGQPHYASAGGKDINGLDAAIEKVIELAHL